ncbi:hypothetical protein EVAR_35219_1 [Eumeta japonica]|uniref:Uncharacterized protein n=1 Tax=Eumeta variegata TaxID=151549 RepID=A0A4C1VG07_EUMVA|nr:hypothetical protein EVAR_35219_1 [Eumeta japonica]
MLRKLYADTVKRHTVTKLTRRSPPGRMRAAPGAPALRTTARDGRREGALRTAQRTSTMHALPVRHASVWVKCRAERNWQTSGLRRRRRGRDARARNPFGRMACRRL